MSINEIANRYVALCKEGQFHKCLDELFSKDAVSVEAFAPPGQDPVATGLAALKGKSEWWNNNHEVHKAEVAGPYPNGNRFAVRFSFDVTNKPSGKRMQMDEVGLFTVENGKIVREEFFYQGG
ncbi:MAG TPA: nuclear transport factor 2 family protein [Polyangiaceae bacterium]|nr:nuclear transport factor 2 family protein [Polyangiaceae bacterium]